MGNRDEVKAFLSSRRAKITPQQVAFSAEAGSPADDALRLLASWAATHAPADALATPTQS